MKRYWKRLGEIARLKTQPTRDELLLELGQAAGQAGASAGLVRVSVSIDGVLAYQLDRDKLRQVRQREGRYLLRTNLDATDPELIWRCSMQLLLVRHTEPNCEVALLLHQLDLTLPPQPPPKIRAPKSEAL